MSDPEEWVTVAEAARRLNLHARQVRRYAARLRTEDRTQEGQSPLKMRLSSLVSLVASSRFEKAQEDNTQDRDRTAEGTGTAKEDSVPPVSLPADQHLIEHLEAEVSFLRASLEAASVERSELRRLLLMEQTETKRLGEVLQIMAGPKAAEAEENSSEEAAPTPIAETPPQSRDVAFPAPPEILTQDLPPEPTGGKKKRRTFWQWLFNADR
jgi:hypothetical protein